MESAVVVERTALALIGNEEAVGAFLLAGWGQRRLSSSLECNWMCARETTPAQEIDAAWQAFISAPEVAVLLVSAAVVRRVQRDSQATMGQPTVVEIPSADTPPRVTCSVYEPYSGWQRKEEDRLLAPNALATTFCVNRNEEASPPKAWSRTPASQEASNPRIDSLVAAVFKVATLGVAEEGEVSSSTSWMTSKQTPNAAMNFKLQVLNAATTETAELLQSCPQGARDVVRALNRQRTRMVDVDAAFPFLAGLVLTVLDRCQSRRDVDSILTAMMLAQSFYRTRGSDGRREYLKSAIQSHPVWADVYFWREALTLCVWKQRSSYDSGERRAPSPTATAAYCGASSDYANDRPPPPPPLTPRPSEEDVPAYASCLPATFRFFSSPERSERVALWSQLGGIVHAMLEFGSDPDTVLAFAEEVSNEHNLSAQHKAVIVQHIETVRRSQQRHDTNELSKDDEMRTPIKPHPSVSPAST